MLGAHNSAFRIGLGSLAFRLVPEPGHPDPSLRPSALPGLHRPLGPVPRSLPLHFEEPGAPRGGSSYDVELKAQTGEGRSKVTQPSGDGEGLALGSCWLLVPPSGHRPSDTVSSAVSQPGRREHRTHFSRLRSQKAGRFRGWRGPASRFVDLGVVAVSSHPYCKDTDPIHEAPNLMTQSPPKGPLLMPPRQGLGPQHTNGGGGTHKPALP